MGCLDEHHTDLSKCEYVSLNKVLCRQMGKRWIYGVPLYEANSWAMKFFQLKVSVLPLLEI